ncbi:hypothetical protein VTK26DRAFT_7753 [Humicola hyalothermophila]
MTPTPASSTLLRWARRAQVQQIFSSSCRHGHSRWRHLSSSINSSPRSLLTLAIETSCDDTCVAILEKSGPAARLLFNKKITSNNIAFRGVHPVTAVESHTSQLALLVREALQSLPRSGSGDRASPLSLPVGDAATGETSLRRLPDFISVTRGPGILSGLGVGLTMAKGLSVAWQVPLVGVHHMQAHALTPRLVHALDQPWPSSSCSPSPGSPSIPAPPSPSFPFLTLLVSGGHTLLVLSRSLTSHTILADKLGVAIGDMLDKCGREILPAHATARSSHVMYGAQLEAFAFPASSSSSSPSQDGPEPMHSYTPPANRGAEIQPLRSRRRDWALTPPFSMRGRHMAFDFAGLGGQVQKITQQWAAAAAAKGTVDGEEDDADRRELAVAAMQLAFEHLASRVVWALQDVGGTPAPPGKDSGEEARDGEDDNPSAGIRTLVVSGGVASNRFLRRVLRAVLDARGFGDVAIVAPPVALCTDNAAMIAWTGAEMYEAGWESELDILPVRKWSFDPNHEGGGGVLELGGWRRRGREGNKDS